MSGEIRGPFGALGFYATGRMEKWFKGRENIAIEIDSLIFIYTDEIISLHVHIAWHPLQISMTQYGHVR